MKYMKKFRKDTTNIQYREDKNINRGLINLKIAILIIKELYNKLIT